MRFLKWLRTSEWSPYVAGALAGPAGSVIAALHRSAPERLGRVREHRRVDRQGRQPGRRGQRLLEVRHAGRNQLERRRPARRHSPARWFRRCWAAPSSGGSSPTTSGSRIFGPAVWKRWLVLFLGAILLEYGAGIAGGCTSGLAISGGLQLTPSAFLFMVGMFASGIPTAMILYRRRY